MQLRTCFPGEARTVSQAQQQGIEVVFLDFNIRDGADGADFLARFPL